MSSESWMDDRLNWNTSLPCTTPGEKTSEGEWFDWVEKQSLSCLKDWEKQPAFILSSTIFPSDLLALKRTKKKSNLLVGSNTDVLSKPWRRICLPPPPSSIISLWHVWLTQIRPSNISSTKCCSTHLSHMSSKQGNYQAQVPPLRATKSHRPEIAVLFKFNLVSYASTTAWKTNTGSVQ